MNMNVFHETLVQERTFVMVKPEGVQRGLVGEILMRLEKRGLRLAALKFVRPTFDQLVEHYIEHKNRDYFQSMINHLSTSGPVVPMVWIGPGSIAAARDMIGQTDPLESDSGSLRGDLTVSIKRTGVHGADSAEAAEREIKIWFIQEELYN